MSGSVDKEVCRAGREGIGERRERMRSLVTSEYC